MSKHDCKCSTCKISATAYLEHFPSSLYSFLLKEGRKEGKKGTNELIDELDANNKPGLGLPEADSFLLIMEAWLTHKSESTAGLFSQGNHGMGLYPTSFFCQPYTPLHNIFFENFGLLIYVFYIFFIKFELKEYQ